MFMAGLETKLSSFREFRGEVAKISLLNGLIPAVAGIWLGLWLFNFDWVAAFLLGIIFFSSAIAVAIPSLQANANLAIRVGRIIIASVIVQDVSSLVLFLVLLRFLEPSASALPEFLFFPLLILSVVSLRWLIPRIHALFISDGPGKGVFEEEVRIVLVSLIGTVAFFEVMGVHALIAGFFTGLVFSEIIKSDILKEKLRTISYGLFVPIFFIVIGAQTNIRVLAEAEGAFALVLFIIPAFMISKFVSGWLGGKLVGFTNKQSFIVGAATMSQLTMALAVVSIARQKDLLGQEAIAALVVLTIVTTFVAPLLIAFLSRKPQEARAEELHGVLV